MSYSISNFPETYRRALDRLTETCRSVAAVKYYIQLPPLKLRYVQAGIGQECIRTDYRQTIIFELASVARLKPPPDGFRCIYGTCHEIGHLLLARMLPRSCVPPVIWDEALAHYFAVHLFVPAVYQAHGPNFWPDPYADYHIMEGEGVLSHGQMGHLGDYQSSLRMLNAQLVAYV